MKRKKLNKATLVKALMLSTGLSYACVYRLLSLSLFPKNPRAAMAWTRTMAKYLVAK